MSKISPELLDKFLRNECSEQEKAQVEAWYASLHGPTDFLSTLSETEQQQLQEETFATIQQDLVNEPDSVVRRIPWRLAIGLAASLLLVLGSIYVTYRSPKKPINNTFQANVHKLEQQHIENAVHFVNQQARPVLHTLPDGSLVWMRAGATISYPKKFEVNKRLVAFSGEAFFDIKKNKHCPFFIQSGEMSIKVLGTSFNVKAMPTRKVFQIAVVTGRVQVSAPDHNQNEQQVVLAPKQQAIFEIASKRLVTAPIPTQIRKEIYEPISVVFDNVPLDQVIEKLQKRYHVTFRLLNPKLSLCRVNADFEQQTLPVIMEMLCTALDVTYTMSDNTILIDGVPCE